MERNDQPDQWVELRDFTPGIYSRSGEILGGSAAGVPAPLGAAQVTNTFRCIALPQGGLGPLPKRTASSIVANPEASAPQSGYWVLGMGTSGAMTQGVGGSTIYQDNVFATLGYQIAAGPQQRARVYRVPVFNSGAIDLIYSVNSGYNGADFYECSEFIGTRVNPTSPYLTPGNPEICFVYSTPGGANEKQIALFPDPSNPAVTGTLTLTASRWGDIIAHQGRIVLLERISYSMGATGGMSVNEQVSFTDPANSQVLGTQNQVFVQEWPTGVGAWGSISAGELFLVKHQGGGFIISGDIAFPTVTRLPGVAGTGSMINNKAASTPYGLFYGCQWDGMYVWRGSDTSEKVSKQLDDDFLHKTGWPTGASANGYSNAGRSCSISEWGSWVLATNNWLYDILTNSWWRIEDPGLLNLTYFVRGFDARTMYANSDLQVQGNVALLYIFDKVTPATNYSWQSHPIPQSVDKRIEVLEMVLMAQGSGTVTVTLTAGDGTTQSYAVTVTDTAKPIKKWSRAVALAGYSIIVRIQSDGGSTAAPTVYSLQLGYKEGKQAA